MLGWLYLTCVLFLSAVALDWCLWMRKRRYFKDLPTYPRLPFIGNLHKIFGNYEYLYHRLSEISSISDKTQKPLVFWVGSKPLLVFHDPEMVKGITNGYVDKPYYYSFANLWLGEGLVTAPAIVWKRNIKKLAGTFTGSVIDGYQDVYNAQAQRLVHKLKTRVGEEPFDVTDDLAITSLETICQTALGVSRISEAIVTKEYYEAFSRTLHLVLHRATNIVMHFDLLYKMSPGYSEMKKTVGVLHKVSNTIMERRKTEREILKRNGVIEKNNAGDTTAKFKSYYDILSDMKEADPTLTEKQIKDEVDTIILAGQETVAITLQYAILMIGCKPDVQHKLHSEIHSIFGDSKRPVTKQDLAGMEYCEAVINEAMRLYPPVPAVIREADHDLVFKSCTIPRGAGCVLNILGAGRSESLWGSDAAEFKPERWLDGAAANPPGFYPFSYGKRACIGKKYAIALLKTILAYVFRELVIQSEADKLKLKIEIALLPASGNLIKVFLRE